MQPEPIDAIDDPRLVDYRGVVDPEWLEQRRLFVVEGRQPVEVLVTHPTLRARSLLVTPSALRALGDALEREGRELPVYLIEPDLLRELGGVKFHQGCLALGERPEEPTLKSAIGALGPGARLVVVLERVSNPDNVGSVFRNGLAFGADLVAIGPGCSHPLYRKSIRTSMGAALRVPFARADDWPADLETLRGAGFTVVALCPRSVSVDLASLERDRPERVALLLGAEGSGISDAALDAADLAVRIPMVRGADSLNVATASGIALHRLSVARLY